MTSRSNERRKRDRQFQEQGLEHLLPEEFVRCDCGHWCEKNRVCRHHIERKATEELRYDASKTIRVCWACHTEIHTLGDVRWAKKHKRRLLLACPEALALILELKAGADEDTGIDEFAIPHVLTDIL